MSALARLQSLCDRDAWGELILLDGEDGASRVPVRFLQMSDGEGVELAGTPAPQASLPPRGEKVRVEYRDRVQERFAAFDSFVLEAVADTPRTWRLRAALPEQIETLNERRSFRVQVRSGELTAVVGLPRTTYRVPATVLDVSDRGVQLLLRLTRDPAGRLRRAPVLALRFAGPALADLEPHEQECEGIVRWRRPGPRVLTMGLELDQMLPALSRGLTRLVYAKQQDALKRHVR